MTCKAKHTKFQPGKEQWRCPECDAGSDLFFVEENALDSEASCEKLHKKDICQCAGCEGGWTGEQVARALMKKLDMETCGLCKGKGVVAKGGCELVVLVAELRNALEAGEDWKVWFEALERAIR